MEKIRLALDAKDGGGCLTIRGEGEAACRRRILEGEAYRPMLDAIRAEARRLLKTEAPALPYSLFKLFKEQGTRLEYERPYFERRRRLNTYALLAWLEPGEEAHARELADIVWLICDEYSWCLPAHIRENDPLAVDLFAAETAFALAEIVSLAGPLLPEPVAVRARREVRRRVLEPYLYGGPWAWERSTHNWAAVCAGSVGAAALHLLDDRDELAAVVDRVLSAMSSFLDGYGDDGVCPEGFGYWTYGFGFFVYFADLLGKATEGRLDLFSLPKIGKIAAFPQICFLSGAAVANFSDALPEYRVQPGLLHYLAGVFEGLPVPGPELYARYTDDPCSRWAHAFRDLVWTAPEGGGSGGWPDLSRYMPDAQWLVSRLAAGGRTYAFAAKGGHNDEPHNHNDLGHFLLHTDGETVLHDLGCGMYTADYFGERRYEYACNGSQGHSVPIVGGALQQPGRSRKARVLRAEAGEGVAVDTLEMDIAGAYDADGLKSWVRRFEWDKTAQPPALRLTDRYEMSAAPDSVVERFVTPARPERTADGEFRLTGPEGRAALRLRFDASLLEPSVREAAFVDHFGGRSVYYELDFRLNAPGQRGTLRFEMQFED